MTLREWRRFDRRDIVPLDWGTVAPRHAGEDPAPRAVKGPVGSVETNPLPKVVHEPFVDLFLDWAQVCVDVVVGYGLGAGELGYDAP